MTLPDRAVVELRRRFTASPGRVFAAFSEASTVARWLRPSPDVALTVMQLDFYAGGAYRFAYGLPDGSTVIVGGKYRSIEPPARIVFSWIIEPPDPHAGIDSLVTVTIVPEGSGAELIIRHERLLLDDAIERHAEGWRGALDRLTEEFN
jgi:uncharacterized protein YndB with AHSA1/START domain